MPSSQEHDEVRRIVGELAREVNEGRRPSGPIEARLAAACRRAVVADICRLLVGATKSAVSSASTALRRTQSK